MKREGVEIIACKGVGKPSRHRDRSEVGAVRDRPRKAARGDVTGVGLWTDSKPARQGAAARSR